MRQKRKQLIWQGSPSVHNSPGSVTSTDYIPVILAWGRWRNEAQKVMVVLGYTVWGQPGLLETLPKNTKQNKKKKNPTSGSDLFSLPSGSRGRRILSWHPAWALLWVSGPHGLQWHLVSQARELRTSSAPCKTWGDNWCFFLSYFLQETRKTSLKYFRPPPEFLHVDQQAFLAVFKLTASIFPSSLINY